MPGLGIYYKGSDIPGRNAPAMRTDLVGLFNVLIHRQLSGQSIRLRGDRIIGRAWRTWRSIPERSTMPHAATEAGIVEFPISNTEHSTEKIQTT